MNQQLIKLIELCLIDGVISDKERSVIFKKSEELGISKDECEIILEGMIQKHSNKNTSQPQKKKGFFGSIMDEVKKNIDVDSITDKVKSIQEEYEKKVEEITNQHQPKTTSSSKTSKPKSTTPKKVSKPKPTPSNSKKTTSKSSTSKKKLKNEKPLRTFLFGSLKNYIGKTGLFEQDFYVFLFYLNKIEIIIRTGFGKEGRGEIIEKLIREKKPKSEIEFLIKDIEIIKPSNWGDVIFEINGKDPSFFSISEDENSRGVKEMNNLLTLLKKNKIKSFQEFQDILLKKIRGLNKELTNFKENGKEYILDFNCFFEVLKNNQSKINEIDREYVQKFIKLNNYLKQKSSNLSTILEKTISNLENEPKETILEREQEINFFKGLVYSYNLMVNHSIVMVTSLVEDDTITFYEIYEVFDKMNVFNTNWENEVNDKLSEINESLQDLNFSIIGLMSQMRSMEKKLVTQLQSINTSIGSLENSVNKQLSETNSRLKYQNLTSYYSKSTLKGSWDWFDGP